jgi:CTP:molybdopterin cytidylyltransferase MocA
MPHDPVIAIVPAAGRSRRMGQPKQLIDVNGVPMLVATLTPLVPRCTQVVVVTHTAVQTAITNAITMTAPNLHVIINDDADTEMIDSIRIGMRNARPDALGWMIVPGDQPALDPAGLDRCLTMFLANPDRIVIATYDDRTGHPMIVPRAFTDLVHGPACDRGLRDLKNAVPERIMTVDCGSSSILRNVNTPEDLASVNAPHAS